MAATASSSGSRAIGGGIEGYYRFHAGIYDLTRWTFLFGRDAILDAAATGGFAPRRILEVGCGTGRNLEALGRRFPRAELHGVDLSDAMLARARSRLARVGSRVTLRQARYGAEAAAGGYDLVLASYALSMFNPGWEEALAAAERDLAPGGRLALVDFHATESPRFARWMERNHVRMEAHLRPELRRRFTPLVDEVRTAYGGVWAYLLFVGTAGSATGRRVSATGGA